ncbi:MAG: endonuclease III [Candidatus Bathyarchaeota archaeon]|nr:endonuclease III [Candidatus Bathyarchaeota archaeon]MDH5688002.1 endonuclease III [Candidatus Bathyarchaeota archaeon]
MSGKERSQEILTLLRKLYPDAKGTALNFSNALELLVATILAAQCTDGKVNQVTKVLLKRYRTPKDYAEADLEELQEIIKPTGFYRSKSKFIKAAAKKLIEDFDSEIPRSIEEMIKLPGVARKTANIVLSNAFGVVEGVAVDTHVMRLSKRLGLSEQKNRDKIERDLMNLFPKEQWFEVANLLIAHGRSVCTARHPKCGKCVVNELCPSAHTFD